MDEKKICDELCTLLSDAEFIALLVNKRFRFEGSLGQLPTVIYRPQGFRGDGSTHPACFEITIPGHVTVLEATAALAQYKAEEFAKKIAKEYRTSVINATTKSETLLSKENIDGWTSTMMFFGYETEEIFTKLQEEQKTLAEKINEAKAAILNIRCAGGKDLMLFNPDTPLWTNYKYMLACIVLEYFQIKKQIQHNLKVNIEFHLPEGH